MANVGNNGASAPLSAPRRGEAVVRIRKVFDGRVYVTCLNALLQLAVVVVDPLTWRVATRRSPRQAGIVVISRDARAAAEK